VTRYPSTPLVGESAYPQYNVFISLSTLTTKHSALKDRIWIIIDNVGESSSWTPTRRNCKSSPYFPPLSLLVLTTIPSRHQISTPSFTFNPNNKFRRDYPPRSFATPVTMNPNELSLKTEPVGLGMWSLTAPQTVKRPRPATIHETGFSYCMPEEYTSLPAWDSSTMPMQQFHDGMPQTYAVQQDFYPSSSMGERKSACHERARHMNVTNSGARQLEHQNL
jgi:hypothetical protein